MRLRKRAWAPARSSRGPSYCGGPDFHSRLTEGTITPLAVAKFWDDIRHTGGNFHRSFDHGPSSEIASQILPHRLATMGWGITQIT